MRILRKMILPAVAVMSLSGHAWAEDLSIREKLLESGAVATLYSIDDHTTLIKTGSLNDISSTLSAICSGHEGFLSSGGNSFRCAGVFEAEQVDSPSEGQSILVKTEIAQPLAYRNPYIPSIEEVAAPPGGKIDGDYASIDIYQYMYALCKKDNGTASVIVSKRFGKVARYTEVSAEEAFSHLLASGEGRDPWFFACESENRFIVEKDYQFNSNGANRFYFHPKRGLEWVDFVKAGSDKVASLGTR